MEEFAENKVEEMSLYIEEQEQQLNEVAGTWGCTSSFLVQLQLQQLLLQLDEI